MWLGGMESICPPAHRARARLGFIPAAGTHGIPTLWGFKGFFPPPWCRLQENQALSPLHLMHRSKHPKCSARRSQILAKQRDPHQDVGRRGGDGIPLQ